jgi:hypothetical protein
VSAHWVNAVVEVLRRDGSIVVAARDIEDVDAWRREVRQACRAAGLRVRTGMNDHGAVWAYHMDHVGTDAEVQAAGRALSNLINDKPAVPFHELVRDEQRKRLTVVDGVAHTAAPASQQPNGVPASLKPPGDIDALVVDYSSRQNAFDDADERSLRAWYAKIQCTDANGRAVHKVGKVLAYTVDFERMADPFGSLDGESADLGHAASVLFDSESGELDSELYHKLEAFGEGFLLIDWVRLEPAWRGHGLGPLLAGMVIEHLGGGRRFVALQAAPSERRNVAGEIVKEISDEERAAAVVKLGALWSELGFEYFRDEVWILDLALRTFSDRMEAVRRRAGLR